jgi:hypothetical protein
MRQIVAPLQALVAITLALTLGAAQAQSTAPAGPPAPKFEPTLPAQGSNTRMLLNGSGTRYRAIFKVYDLALYTTKKVSTVDELLALQGPKRLQFIALRELPSTDLGRLFIKGLQENSSKDLVQKHAISSARLIEVFSGKSKLLPGETFAMEFIPGKGTLFFITGKPQGEPVGDAEFFGMILKIWVGTSPADNLLKDALLGVEQR